jgi:hypothetical protein
MGRRWSYPVVGRRVGVRDGERVDDGVEAHELFRMLGLLRTRTERAHAWVCRRGRGHIRGTFCRDLARHCVDPGPLSTLSTGHSRLTRQIALPRDARGREIARIEPAASGALAAILSRMLQDSSRGCTYYLPADPSHLSLIFRSSRASRE